MRAARVLGGYESALELAAELGYKTQRTILKVETGAQQPDARLLHSWARACGLPIDWFFIDFAELTPAEWPDDPIALLDEVDRRIGEALARRRR